VSNLVTFRGEGVEVCKMWFLKNVNFETPRFWTRSFFRRVFLFSQNQDNQPLFKFYMEHGTSYIYRRMVRVRHSGNVCVRQLYAKSQNSDRFEMPRDTDLSRKPQSFLYHSIDRRHIFLDLKFEEELFVSLSRKHKFKNGGCFFQGEDPFFFSL
jgi:hypothetical protein